MGYFNYHAKAKKLIREKQLWGYKITTSWNSISPALVLFFIDNIPMPIREHKWNDYLTLIKQVYSDKNPSL